MGKKKKIDFVLSENNDEKLIFRFYPRQSNCHSFNEKLPTKWEEVYKVYYAYSIVSVSKEDNYTTIPFKCYCDECSIINEIASRIALIVQGYKQVTRVYDDREYIIELLNTEVEPSGYGVSWIINDVNRINDVNGFYEIVLWNYDETGYRFYLNKDSLEAFGLYLQSCCDYMLAHGDPI